MNNFQFPKVANKKLAALWICMVILLVSLLVYVLIRENDERSFKNQAHLLGISEREMRDYTNIGCALWHHAPKNIPYAEDCYLHTYARYERSSEESMVKERLKSNGWVRQNYKPNFFIMPRGTDSFDVVFFKNVSGDTYCVGIEYGAETFNLHVFSDTDDNCKKLVSSSPNFRSK